MLYIDFDDTIVQTRHLYFYRKNLQGRQFLTQNARRFKTEITDPDFKGFLETHKEHTQIWSNSPQNYVHAFLQVHNLPLLETIGSAEKPFTRTTPIAHGIVIGDSPLDILFARHFNMPSIAFTKATPFPRNQLEKAAPSAYAHSVKELETLLAENIKMKFPDVSELHPTTQFKPNTIQTHTLGTYYPWRHPDFYQGRGNDILALKRCKDFTIEEIYTEYDNYGYLNDTFFHHGSFKQTAPFKDLLERTIIEFQSKIEDIRLSGSTRVIPCPNSLPEWAYLLDINDYMSKALNTTQQIDRGLYKINPSKAAHHGGARDSTHLYNTIATHKDINLNFDNIILLDDVTTTGNMMNISANALRNRGYDGNILGLTIAKTP
ncbi:MAG: hypothetical protein ACMXYK_01295 [Candidatus Woesearchaeota archaeon]